MIFLEKNTTNTFYLTCYEKLTLSDPYYLLELENEFTHQKYYAVLTDVSLYPKRYQLFNLTLPTDINLITTDDYRYTVYEQESNSNLDPELAGSIVESGRMRLIEGNPIQEVIPEPTGDTNTAYEREEESES